MALNYSDIEPHKRPQAEPKEHCVNHPAFLPAALARQNDLPWIPSSTPGKSSKPLCFMPNGQGFVELLRMEPGVQMPLHRHTGEIHAFNLSGERLLCTGERIGPGDYVYEPVGNVDAWEAVGDVPLVVLVIVYGTVEFLDDQDQVTYVATAAQQRQDYLAHCAEHGLPVLNLDA